jgi:hypothetical protein
VTDLSHVARITGNIGSMLRMRALAATLLVALCAAGGIAATTASAGSDVQATYVKYAKIRDKLIACSLDRSVHQLGEEVRKHCPRYRELYTLWSEPGESFNYHVHCNTKKCPAQPIGEPDPRDPIPRGAHTFR